MKSIKPYAHKEWNDFDIPTPSDLQNIENGIFNNNSDIIALNDELTNYESEILAKYNEYKTNINNSFQNEVTKLNNIKTQCDVGFNTLKAYTNTVSTILFRIENTRTRIEEYEEKLNKFIVNLVKNEFTEDQSFTETIDYTGTPINGFVFPDWVSRAHIEYSRRGTDFSLYLKINGNAPSVTGPVMLCRIPCTVTPADDLKLNIIGGYVCTLRPDGSIIFNNSGAVFTELTTSRISLTNSIWRYDIQNFYELF